MDNPAPAHPALTDPTLTDPTLTGPIVSRTAPADRDPAPSGTAPAAPDSLYRRSAAPTPSTLPSIADYWPDAPHRIGPPADHYTDEPTEAAVDALRRSGRRDREPTVARAPSPPRRRSRRPALLGAALTVLLAAAGITGFALARHGDSPWAAGTPQPQAPTPASSPRAAPPSPDAPSRARAVSAPVRGRQQARFELVSDAAEIDLRAAGLGDELYRITTPDDSGVLPRAQLGATGVRLFLDDNGERGGAAVTVLLNADVRWSVRITGGVRAGVFDLGAAKVDEVDFAGGAARIDLTLPDPDGTLPVRLSGGVNRFEVSAGRGVPVRVRTRRGAGQVRLDGRTDDGVARGASFLSPHWADSENRIDLDAVAGVGTLRVGRG